MLFVYNRSTLFNNYFVFQIALLVAYMVINNGRDDYEWFIWIVCCIAANISICILGWWRCFANNYLHWAAMCTWLLLNIQGWSIIHSNGSRILFLKLAYCMAAYLTGDYRSTGCYIWYFLFILFVPYAMLPLPLRWCMIAGTVSASGHVLVSFVVEYMQVEV